MAGDTEDSDQSTQLAPIPDAAALLNAMSLLSDVYGQELKNARSADEKTALAKTLLGQAATSKGDPAIYYVLLKTSLDTATEAGNAQLAFEAITRMATTFRIDALAMRLSVLARAADSGTTPAHHQATVRTAFSVIDAAIASDNFSVAVQAAELANTAARKSRIVDLKKQALDRLRLSRKMAAQFSQLDDARIVLKENATDPDANFSVGRFLCLGKGDWNSGIPMLAIGSHKELRELALQELESPTIPTQQMQIADAWWAYAKSVDDNEHLLVMERAGYWYNKSLPGLTNGLQRAKVQKQLASLKRLKADAAPDIKPPSRDTRPAVRPTPDATKSIIEGVGYGPFRVGASKNSLIKALGPPDAGSTDQWIQWKQKFHIHCLVDSDRGAFELRFEKGFTLALSSGIAIGSPEQAIERAYGKPNNLTTRGTGRKYEYSSRGVLFWTNSGRVSQIVVFRPSR